MLLADEAIKIISSWQLLKAGQWLALTQCTN
jgi:hypothetical protein